jgi:hypothetical protein
MDVTKIPHARLQPVVRDRPRRHRRRQLRREVRGSSNHRYSTHADIKQTQRYLNITDAKLRKSMKTSWERCRRLHAVEKGSEERPKPDPKEQAAS